MEQWQDLTGKIVMVTGASSGSGREFSLNLAKAGCKIIAAARRVDRLKSLCDEINSQSNSANQELRAVAIELDVAANGATIEAAVLTAWNAFGRIDALVNNAGQRGSVLSSLELSEEEWNNIMKTNLRGAWLVSKYVCIHMRNAKQGGAVINISSIMAINRVASGRALAYASSKAALDMMTKTMAIELGVYNIRVNSIAPGIFKSEITKGIVDEPWTHNVSFKVIPLRTIVKVDPALTSVVRYLIHDSSAYVSGNIFITDAGNSLPGVPIFSSL